VVDAVLARAVAAPRRKAAWTVSMSLRNRRNS